MKKILKAFAGALLVFLHIFLFMLCVADRSWGFALLALCVIDGIYLLYSD